MKKLTSLTIGAPTCGKLIGFILKKQNRHLNPSFEEFSVHFIFFVLIFTGDNLQPDNLLGFQSDKYSIA